MRNFFSSSLTSLYVQVTLSGPSLSRGFFALLDWEINTNKHWLVLWRTWSVRIHDVSKFPDLKGKIRLYVCCPQIIIRCASFSLQIALVTSCFLTISWLQNCRSGPHPLFLLAKDMRLSAPVGASL